MTRILTNNSDNNKGKMEKRSFLFDLDGVIFDTESQYTVFWDRIGKEYLSEESFGSRRISVRRILRQQNQRPDFAGDLQTSFQG